MKQTLCPTTVPTTQTIACAARDAGFDAVLSARTAALPGCETLGVFVQALPNVTARAVEGRQLLPRLADFSR